MRPLMCSAPTYCFNKKYTKNWRKTNIFHSFFCFPLRNVAFACKTFEKNEVGKELQLFQRRKCGIEPTPLKNVTDICFFPSLTFFFISISLACFFHSVAVSSFLTRMRNLMHQDCRLVENHEGCLNVLRRFLTEFYVVMMKL